MPTLLQLPVFGVTSKIVALSSGTVDWQQTKLTGGIFTRTLTANTTITFTNPSPGQTIIILLTNTASNFAVTWPGTVKWGPGGPPVMTDGAKSDVYTILYDGTNYFGTVIQNF